MNAARDGRDRLCLALLLGLLAVVGPTARFALAEDCSDLILDGGFEVGGAWDLGVTLLTPTYVTDIKHSGNQSLALGITQGGNANSYSSARQSVVIPAGADRAMLSFWFYALVEGQPHADKMQLVLLNPDGSTEHVLWTSRADSRAWNQLTFDVSRWQGRALQVYFNVYNDGVGGTVGMFLDDVSLVACPSETTQVPVSPFKTPGTAQPSKTPAPTRTPCGMVPPCATLPPPPHWATPWESMPASEPPPSYWATTPWASMPAFEPPPSYWATPAWAPNPTASFLEETVSTGEVPTAISSTPVATAGVAGRSTDAFSSSTPTVLPRATETPPLSSPGELGFTPEVTRVSLALTAVPTPPASRTNPPITRSPNATSALGAAQASGAGRYVQWPGGWWWGVVAVVVVILGAWLLTRFRK